jgi:uncharacterized protein (DUF433 family)
MPKSTPVSVRLQVDTLRAAQELARRTSRSLGAVVSELAEEGLRMQQHPGIVFAGPMGRRRARVEGSGLDVWEVVMVYRDCSEDAQKTLTILTHLTPRQVEAAIRYSRSYQNEIDALIQDNQRPIEEWVRLYPHIRAIKV